MTSDRFFIQKNQIKAKLAVLKGDEHHHLSRVLRKKRGEKICLFTENGQNYLARIEKIEKSQTFLTLLEKIHRKEAQNQVILAPSLIKSKAMELILQKSTELGVSRFSPIFTDRSVIHISGKAEKKMKRWNRIVLEASKQCQRPSPPNIERPVCLKEFLDQKNADIKIFLNEKGGMYLKDFIFSLQNSKHKSTRSMIVLLGPEGGWTDKEEHHIVQNGYKPVSLGKNILRSETAAIACVSIISHLWNR